MFLLAWGERTSATTIPERLVRPDESSYCFLVADFASETHRDLANGTNQGQQVQWRFNIISARSNEGAECPQLGQDFLLSVREGVVRSKNNGLFLYHYSAGVPDMNHGKRYQLKVKKIVVKDTLLKIDYIDWIVFNWSEGFEEIR